jgi:hypothetical protein
MSETTEGQCCRSYYVNIQEIKNLIIFRRREIWAPEGVIKHTMYTKINKLIYKIPTSVTNEKLPSVTSHGAARMNYTLVFQT